MDEGGPVCVLGKGFRTPGGRRDSEQMRGRRRLCGPSSLAFALAGPGVLERGRAGTSLVTWARTGEVERAQPLSGRGSLSGLTVLHLAASCTGPGQAETDRCTHLDCLTHAHFLPGIYTILRVGFFFFFPMWAVVEPRKVEEVLSDGKEYG